MFFPISMAAYFCQEQHHITFGFLHLLSILLFSTAAAAALSPSPSPSPSAARLRSKFSTTNGVLSSSNPKDMTAAAAAAANVQLRLQLLREEPMMDIEAGNRQRREEVDAEMLDYAMRRLRQEGRDAKTGQAYEVRLPSWTEPPLRGGADGVVRACQVMRAEPGSLRRRGLLFNGFNITQGTQVHHQQASSAETLVVPRVTTNITASHHTLETSQEHGVTTNITAPHHTLETNQQQQQQQQQEQQQQEQQQFLLLIYRSLDNHLALDFTFYQLPPGYTFISPIFGIIGYTYTQLLLLNNNTSRSTDSSSPVLTKVELSSDSMTTVAIPSTNSFNLTTSSRTTTPPYNANASPPAVTPLCAFFLPNGSFYFSNLSHPPNICSSFIVSDTALVLPPPPTPPSPDMANLLRPKTSTIHAYPTSSSSTPNTTTIPPKIALILAFAGSVGLGTLMMAAAILLARGCRAMPDNSTGNLLSKSSQQLPEALHGEPCGIAAQITGHTTNLHHDEEISAATTASGCLTYGLGHAVVIHGDDQNTQLLYDHYSHHTRAPSVPALRTKPSLEVGSLHAMVSS